MKELECIKLNYEKDNLSILHETEYDIDVELEYLVDRYKRVFNCIPQCKICNKTITGKDIQMEGHFFQKHGLKVHERVDDLFIIKNDDLCFNYDQVK